MLKIRRSRDRKHYPSNANANVHIWIMVAYGTQVNKKYSWYTFIIIYRSETVMKCTFMSTTEYLNIQNEDDDPGCNIDWYRYIHVSIAFGIFVYR